MSNEELIKAKDNAYWERNQLVAALSKFMPSYLARHPDEDTEWEDDWRNIVVIEIPPEYTEDGRKEKSHPNLPIGQGLQMTWHIHDHDLPMFDHLLTRSWHQWDGHSTQEKYRRLRLLSPVAPIKETE